MSKRKKIFILATNAILHDSCCARKLQEHVIIFIFFAQFFVVVVKLCISTGMASSF